MLKNVIYQISNLIRKIMKINYLMTLALFTSLTTLSSCAVVGGIFKAGMGVGIIAVILVIALIIFLISKIGKNK